jgi:hypothetical protein
VLEFQAPLQQGEQGKVQGEALGTDLGLRVGEARLLEFDRCEQVARDAAVGELPIAGSNRPVEGPAQSLLAPGEPPRRPEQQDQQQDKDRQQAAHQNTELMEKCRRHSSSASP